MLNVMAVDDNTYWNIVFDYVLSPSTTIRSLAEDYGIGATTVRVYLHKTAEIDPSIHKMVCIKASLNQRFETQGTYAADDAVIKHLRAVQKKLNARKTTPPNMSDYLWKGYKGTLFDVLGGLLKGKRKKST